MVVYVVLTKIWVVVCGVSKYLGGGMGVNKSSGGSINLAGSMWCSVA